MKKVTSKIKTIFNEELLRYIAAICDTRRIPSNNKKMIQLCNLLYTYGIEFEILGGATNRIALQIDGYAVKFAMDDQGYRDNLIEYSLSPELQPYVTKSYETNGYIQIQECVEVMSKESFQVYKVEICKILDALCQDYLLGDVGFLVKNRTNWGMKNHKPVILDYAYCHRATENLFTCSKCGAPLKYDSTYDKLMCSDRSSCKSIYTYNDRKLVQGEEVDLNMIKERKAQSIKLSKGEISKDIEMFEDRLIGDNYFIIDNPGDKHRYEQLKEELTMRVNINGGDDNMGIEERFAAMVELAKNPDDAKANEIMISSITEEEIPEPIYTDNYYDNYLEHNIGIRPYPLASCDEEPNNDDDEETYSLEDMINQTIQSRIQYQDECVNRADAIVNEYLKSKGIESEDSEDDVTEEEPNKEPNTGMDDEEMGKLIDNFLKENNYKTDENGNVVNLDGSPISTDEEIENAIREESQLRNKHEEKETDDTPTIESSSILINGKPISVGEEVEV